MFLNLNMSQALLAIQQEARWQGLMAFHLQTESYNHQAKRLYEMLSFQDQQRSTLT